MRTWLAGRVSWSVRDNRYVNPVVNNAKQYPLGIRSASAIVALVGSRHFGVDLGVWDRLTGAPLLPDAEECRIITGNGS